MKAKKIRKKRLGGWIISNRQVMLGSSALFILITVLSLNFVSNKLTPTLMDIAQNEAEQAVMYAINYGLSNATLQEMEHDIDLSRQNIIEKNKDFFIAKYDSKGNIESIIFDNVAIRDYLFKTTARIQSFMRLVENGTISIEHGSDRIIRINKNPVRTSASIPLGQVTDSSLFGNLGPSIPVNFQPLSDVETNIDRRLKETGINNIQIQLVIHVKVNVRVVLPFATQNSVLSEDIPIAEYTYTGDIPKYINGKPSSETKSE
ncbi:MAG: sporulation protein YunB [Tuberibacillus sp.]